MKESYIKNALNVPLKLHWSIAILLGLFILQAGLLGIPLFVIIVGSVLFHEYAHVWMALRQNIHVPKVVFFALGAAAMMDGEQFILDDKKHLKVAAAGPLSSLLLAAIGSPLLLIFGTGNIFLSYFCIINLILAVFNALPLYPSDGGRMLCALLSMKFGILKATNIVTIVTYILCSLGLVLAVIYKLFFMAIVFVFLMVFAYLQKKGVEQLVKW